jgi:toxin ParE1/3/4
VKPFCSSVAAEKDLKQIWRYTAQHYGTAQADSYTDALQSGCQKITKNPTGYRAIRLANHDIRIYRCEHHYILYLVTDPGVVIIAFFHERMNLLVRLQARLGG